MQEFLQPLLPEEERHYLILSRQGDMNARNLLVEHNLRLVAHIVKKYHKGICLKCHEEADNLLDYDEFIQRCTCRVYGTFALGTTLQLDVTDFATAPYDELMIRINELLEFQ